MCCLESKGEPGESGRADDEVDASWTISNMRWIILMWQKERTVSR